MARALLFLVLLGVVPVARGAPFCAVCGGGGYPPMRNSLVNASCTDAGATIVAVNFASYGTPSGACPAFALGPCDAASSRGVVEAECLGQHSCVVFANNTSFGGDPCAGTVKVLAVALTCSTGEGAASCSIYDPPVPCLANVAENAVAGLGCPVGGVVTAVTFASFGTPPGSCASGLAVGACHSDNSSAIVAAACLGRQACDVQVTDALFGDNCTGTRKHFSAVVECSPNLYSITDSRLGPVFDGVGAVFTGGSARLLMEYAPEQRAAILDYLFAPSGAPSTTATFKGAALSILRLEIGGDGNGGGDGSEPSHAHTAGGVLDAGRSWAGWLAQQAIARNPRIKLLVSPVTWPSWLRSGASEDPFDNPTQAATYVAQFVDLFQTRWGVSVGFVGVWASALGNVAAADPRQRAYVLALRAALDARELLGAQIVCADGGAWGCAELLDSSSPNFDAAISAAVGVLGNAGRPPATANLASAARPVWMTRYFSSYSAAPQPAINSGALSVSDEWMEAFVSTGGTALSGFLYSAGLTAVAYGSPTWALGLMQATQPWSGSWLAAVPLWALAHVNQFVGPGAQAGTTWRALPVGQGSDRLAAGGLYICFVETALGLGEWACVIQKFADWQFGGDVSNVGYSQAAIFEENATFVLAGPTLRIPPGGAEVWQTDYAIYRPWQNLTLFARQANAAVDAASRSFTLSLSGTCIYTVTSLSPSLAAQGCADPACESLPPLPAAFGARAMTFASDACPAGQPGTFMQSVYGTFECVADPILGGVLRQTADGAPVGDALAPSTVPHALTGDLDTSDIDVSIDVSFDGSAMAAMLGAHVSPWLAIKRGVAPALAFAQAPGIWLRVAPSADGGGLTWSVVLGLDAASRSAPVLAGLATGATAGAWHTLRLVVRGARVVGSVGSVLLFNADLGVRGAPSTGFVGLATSEFVSASGPAFRNLRVASAETTCDAVPTEGSLVDVEICQAGKAGLTFVFAPTGEYPPSANYYRRLFGVDVVGGDSGVPMPGTLDTSYDAWRAACDADATPGSPPGTFCFGFSSAGLAKLSLDDIAPATAGANGAPVADLFLKTLPAGQLKLASNTSLCLDATPGALRLLLRVCDDPAAGPVFGTQMWQIEKTLTDGVVVYGVVTSGRAGPFTGAGVIDIFGLTLLDVDDRVNIQVAGYNGGSNQLFDFGASGLLRASHMGVCLGACRALA